MKAFIATCVWICAVMLIAIFLELAEAAEMEYSTSGDNYSIDKYRLHANFLLVSNHYTERNSSAGDYNEVHNGIGLTWINRTNHESWTVNTYTNSFGDRSFAVSGGKQLGCWSVACIGVAVTAATGYEAAPVIFAPFLTLSVGPVYSMHLPGAVSAYGLLIPIEE